MAGRAPLPELAPPADPRHADALAVLTAEWGHVEAGIGRYDTLQFQVRGWAISLVVAIVAASVTLREPRMALLGIVVAVLFWWIEALHSRIKNILIQRVRRLQEILALYLDGKSELIPFSDPMIAECFSAAWRQPLGERFRRVAWASTRINVFITYLSLVAVSLACWAAAQP